MKKTQKSIEQRSTCRTSDALKILEAMLGKDSAIREAAGRALEDAVVAK